MAVIGSLYALLCGGACAVHRSMLFPAPRDARTPELPGGALVRIPGGPAGSTVFALYRAAADRDAPTVVHFHGNGEQLADQAWLAGELIAHGLGVMAVEYPGYGLARAARVPATEANLYAAAERALVHLRDALGVPASQVVLAGQSLGTGVAAEMARRGHGARLVLVSPYTSIVELTAHIAPALPASVFVRDRFDTESKARAIAVPVLIAHGARDELIPYEMGVRLARTFPRATLETIDGAGHNDVWVGARGAALVARIAAFARGG